MTTTPYPWRAFWLETLALVPLLGAWAWIFSDEPGIAAAVPVVFTLLTLYDAARQKRSPRLLLAGMMSWVFAFTPEPHVIGVIPGWICLLMLIERAPTTRAAMKWIAVLGAVAVAIGYNWIAPTVVFFGGLPMSIGVLAACLFGIAGTIHAWIFAIGYRVMLARGHRPSPFTVAVLFAAAEALPIRFFPWLVGYGAVDVPPLVQHAEWGGVSGVSLAVLFLVAPIYEWLRWAFGKQARPVAALVTFGIGIAMFGWGFLRYGQVRAADDGAQTMMVAIVQTNIGAMEKRDEERSAVPAQRQSAKAYKAGSERAVAEYDPELIVWPETAVTEAVPFWRQQHSGRSVNQQLAVWGYPWLRTLGADRGFLIGAYEEARTDRQSRWGDSGTRRNVDRYNDAALRQPGGRDATWSWVRKIKLIPFGEAMPLGLPDDLLPQNFTMRAGSAPQEPLVFRDRVLVPFLCYEGILPNHVLAATGGKRPDMLVSLTNDSWFGDSWEPHQHLAFTRFRAVEHRAPLIRATNTGISAFVDSAGDVVETLGVGQVGVIAHAVPLVDRGRTVFARFGHTLPLLLYAMSLLAMLVSAARMPRKIETEA